MPTATGRLLAATGSLSEDQGGSFVVAPDPLMILWTVGVLVWAVAALAGAWILLAKRRWGWLALGLITGGAAWFAGPFVDAAADSPWARKRSAAPGAGRSA